MQSHLLRCTVAVLASVSSTLLDPVPADAQGDDPDAKAYFTYQLTMPKYKKYLSARVNLSTASLRNPAVEEARGRVLFPTFSHDKAAAGLDAVPEARRVVAAAGLTSRDFVLIERVFLRATGALSNVQVNNVSPDAAAKEEGVSRANLEFVQKNDAEIIRLTSEADAKDPTMAGP